MKNLYLQIVGLGLVALIFPTFINASTITDFSVSVSSDNYEIGETIDISWTVPVDSQSPSHWVGLYKVDGDQYGYEAWKYIGSSAISGSVNLTAKNPGTYEIRLYKYSGYILAAKSNEFVIGEEEPPEEENPEYELIVSETSIGIGESVAIEWSVSGDTNVRNDWIGLYEVDSSNNQYIQWFYVKDSSGDKNFTLNNEGEFEFRYFIDGGYTKVSTSESVTVTSDEEPPDDPPSEPGEYSLETDKIEYELGENITLSWTADSTDNLRSDWIGLYRIDASNNSYISWFYPSSEEGDRSISVSRTGEYEFRYLKNNGYTVVAVSNNFTVIDTDEPEPPSEEYTLYSNKTSYQVGEVAEAIWDAPDDKFIFLDWIGLYKVGTSNGSYLDWEYVDRLSNKEYFPLNQTGTFEFRYFLKNGYTQVATSEPFTVTDEEIPNQCNGYNLEDVTNYPSNSGPVIALGDSLTFGVGAAQNQNFVDELEKRLGVNVINEGISGDTTEDILLRLDNDVLDRDPSTVIVLIGGNDEIRRFYQTLSDSAADRELADQLDAIAMNWFGYEWDQVPLISRAETISNLEQIIEEIQAVGANTIVVGFDNIFIPNELESGFRTVASETGSVYIPNIYEGVFGRPSLMSDLVHPNDAGYDIFASRIQLGLECLLD